MAGCKPLRARTKASTMNDLKRNALQSYIMNPDILIVIPARGGSKGIPRKNLRSLNGFPLIYYAIRTAKASAYRPDVYVSTDDDEIAFFARKFGAKVYMRPQDLGVDSTTLDPVIIDARDRIQSLEDKTYAVVATMQPTSPLLSVHSLDAALARLLKDGAVDTLISVINDTHLTWSIGAGGEYVPNYKERVNRQYLPQVFKETGGFLISRGANLDTGRRIGGRVSLFELPAEEAIDVDTYEDWSICEYQLKRKHLLFRVAGYPEIGLGHIYNCLVIAGEILNHRISFLVDDKSRLGYEKIKENNFPVHMQASDNILEDIERIGPELVINDCLDTDADYMLGLRDMGIRAINIEDLGTGVPYAEAVINAMYPEKVYHECHFHGPRYFCARDEFLFHEARPVSQQVKRVLITFGGVDPNNLTQKVLESIYGFCVREGIEIDVVTGLGYRFFESLEPFERANVARNVKNISDYIHRADIAFSSAGRTVYELAIMATPTIVLAQNDRELTHFFAFEEYGFRNMGLGKEVANATILAQFEAFCADPLQREAMAERMRAQDMRNGKKRVVEIINHIVKNENSKLVHYR